MVGVFVTKNVVIKFSWGTFLTTVVKAAQTVAGAAAAISSAGVGAIVTVIAAATTVAATIADPNAQEILLPSNSASTIISKSTITDILNSNIRNPTIIGTQTVVNYYYGQKKPKVMKRSIKDALDPKYCTVPACRPNTHVMCEYMVC